MEAIGAYQLLEIIGRGQVSTIYRAREGVLGRDIAVKLVAPAHRERILQEGQFLARLHHPHIIPIHETGSINGYAFIAMAYAGGGSLLERMEQYPTGMPLPDVVAVVAQVAAALDHAHKRGVVHRDVRAANVLFDQRGYAYLTDFGTAVLIHRTEQSDALLDDIYMLGVLAFELLAGKRPIPWERLREAEIVPDLRQWRPDLPPGVHVVIGQALSIEPHARPASAMAMARTLARAARLCLPIDLEGQQHGPLTPIGLATIPPAIDPIEIPEEMPLRDLIIGVGLGLLVIGIALLALWLAI